MRFCAVVNSNFRFSRKEVISYMKKEKLEGGKSAEKIKAPTHKRKKEGKKKQMTKSKVREKLAKLQEEAMQGLEETKKAKKEKSKETKKKEAVVAKDKKPSKKVKNNARRDQDSRVAPKIERDINAKVRVISLGGLNEIGKNITVFNCLSK